MNTSPAPELRSPAALARRLDRLSVLYDAKSGERKHLHADYERICAYLGVAASVSEALEQLSSELFEHISRLLERNLTQALVEVLDQPIAVKVTQTIKNKAAAIEFSVLRDGCDEDIIRGQGGSVANVLSVGLRMYALATLDPKTHRPFLVLDEQDCWLRPDLVPRLVQIVYRAGRELGFQVIMISHHDHTVFEHYADRIYRFAPAPDGVKVELWKSDAPNLDIQA
jgi:hypothetical protein